MVTRNAISAPTGAAGTVYTGQGVGSRPTWVAPAAGDVTAAANLTDHYVVRGDGGAKGVQTSTMVIDDNGQMLNPSQPAFWAQAGAGRYDVTGDGTYFLASCNVELFDQNGDYNNGTYTFTAPVTGIYQFNSFVKYSGVPAITALSEVFSTSNRGYYTRFSTGSGVVDVNNQVATNGSTIADMDAADTMILYLYANGGTLTMDIVYVQADRPSLCFSGYLIC